MINAQGCAVRSREAGRSLKTDAELLAEVSSLVLWTLSTSAQLAWVDTNMSSTYVHYTSSSLPSDYALLSRYSATQSDSTTSATQSEQAEASSVAPSSHLDEEEDEDSGVPIQANGSGRPLTQRRSSLPNSRLPPFNPTMSPLPDRHGHRSGPHLKKPNENTPLLAPPVPRIEEECDTSPDDGTPRFSSMFREEMGILTKYTLPVFGYAHFLPLCSPVVTSHLRVLGLIFSSTPSSWLRSFRSDTCPLLLSPPRRLAQ